MIERALEEAPGAHRYDSALNAKMTLVCVLVGCLFPGEGYDRVLARAFGLPGLRFRPGRVPTASALSQARERLGEHAVRRLFEIDAETGEERDVRLDARAREIYLANLTRHRREIRSFCHRAGVQYALYDTSTDLEDFVLTELAALGLLRE